MVHQVHPALNIKCVPEAAGHVISMRGLKMIQKGTPVTASGGAGCGSKEAGTGQGPKLEARASYGLEHFAHHGELPSFLL